MKPRSEIDNDSATTPPSGTGELRRRITNCLRSAQAVSMHELVSAIGIDATAISVQLAPLVAAGGVAVLSPVAGGGERLHSQYYRLIRQGDSNHLWEQQLDRRRPLSLSLLGTAIELDAGLARRPWRLRSAVMLVAAWFKQIPIGRAFHANAVHQAPPRQAAC